MTSKPFRPIHSVYSRRRWWLPHPRRGTLGSVLAASLLSFLTLGVALAGDAGASPVVEPQLWRWPVDATPTVVRGFEPPGSTWGAGHRGIDLQGVVAEPVRAIGPGKVIFAGSLAGRGVLVIEHATLRSTYEPVTAAVHSGDMVEAGQLVGLLQGVGSHCAPAACLHLGVKQGDSYLDPLTLFEPLPIRLQPLDDRPVSSMPSVLVPTSTAEMGSPSALRSIGAWMQRPRLGTVLLERG
jgi:murein DD-endopeptidase MepM/ murein hydrolase activator NlpD